MRVALRQRMGGDDDDDDDGGGGGRGGGKEKRSPVGVGGVTVGARTPIRCTCVIKREV